MLLIPTINNHTAKLERLAYPITPDGYAESISASNGEEILARLDRFGLVAVPILSAEERAKTLKAFFRESNEQQRPCATEKLSMDPLTWGDENWPNSSHFLVRRRPTVALEPTLVRTNPKIQQVFATIFGTDKLQTSIDRWGVMRGTVNIPTRQEDGTIIRKDRPEWRQNLRLHWDMNPWAYVEEDVTKRQPRYQALVAILDSPKEVGGFRCVPGSHHRYLEQWANTNEMPQDYNKQSYRSVKVSENDPAQALSQPIPVKAGDMLVFDSRLLHGTYPNESSSMRLVQYVRMMPQSMAKGDVFSAENVLRWHPNWRDILTSYPLDDRSKQLLGLPKSLLDE